jgi:hypothetical protein
VILFCLDAKMRESERKSARRRSFLFAFYGRRPAAIRRFRQKHPLLELQSKYPVLYQCIIADGYYLYPNTHGYQ